MPPATDASGPLGGLLLDIGWVVHATGIHLVGRLAEREPALAPVLERIGGIATERDELWQQMLRREVTEREYWAQRATELGAAIGESWDTRTMIGRIYELPQQGTGEWRARLTGAEPTMRCTGLEELPTTITTVSPGCSSLRALATEISSAVIGPWRRWKVQSSL